MSHVAHKDAPRASTRNAARARTYGPLPECPGLVARIGRAAGPGPYRPRPAHPRPAATPGTCPTITSSTWTASASRHDTAAELWPRHLGARRRRLPRPELGSRQYALTRYANAEARPGLSPGIGNVRPSWAEHGPGRWWYPPCCGLRQPRQPASSSWPQAKYPPNGRSGPAPCRPASAATPAGTVVSAVQRRRWLQRLRRPHRRQPGRADRPGIPASPALRPGPHRRVLRRCRILQDCDAPYCYPHWHYPRAATVTAPSGSGSSARNSGSAVTSSACWRLASAGVLVRVIGRTRRLASLCVWRARSSKRSGRQGPGSRCLMSCGGS